METTLKNGLTMVQQNPDCAVDLTGGEWHGWLFAKNPADGQWVSVRKLEGWEIMQAEDQRDSGIVQHGTSVRGPARTTPIPRAVGTEREVSAMSFESADQVFDWAHRLSDRVQKVAQFKEASAMLAAHKRCGQCDNWMKSSQCPREVNVKGMNHGPSCKSMPCDKFVESRAAIQQRESLTTKVESLRKELTTGATQCPTK